MQYTAESSRYSGLAILVCNLAKLADDNIKQLNPSDLNLLKNCCETAIGNLCDMQGVGMRFLMETDDEGFNPYPVHEYTIAAAETVQELQELAGNLAVYRTMKGA